MGTLHLVGFAEIGSYLREVRQSLGMDAAQAARALHLRPKFLEAIEAGNLDELPGLTYARGYLTSYADYLQLDRAVLLKAFDEATQFRPGAPYSPEPTRREVRPDQFPFCVPARDAVVMRRVRLDEDKLVGVGDDIAFAGAESAVTAQRQNQQPVACAVRPPA